MTQSKQKQLRKIATVAALVAVALIAVLSTVALIASLLPEKQANTPEPSTSDSPPPSVTDPPNTPDSPASPDSPTAAYEALIGYLQDELLSLKEEAFITKSEYEARMEALEKALADANASSPSDDIPVSGQPDTTPDTSAPPPATDHTSVFRYTVHEDAVTITSYIGGSLHVTVPSHIGDLPVTRIEDDAFRCSAVGTVTLPETVTDIGWFAFADNPGLMTVTLPATLTSIGYGAFDNTPSLTLITPKDSYAEAYAQSFAIPHTSTP